MIDNENVLAAAYALLLPACGEKVGMRGCYRLAQTCGWVPSPARFARDLSPHSGERSVHNPK